MTFSEGSDSLRKWSTNVILMVILALAGLALSDSRSATKENTKDIGAIQKYIAMHDAVIDGRLLLLEDHYQTIREEMKDTNDLVRDLSGKPRRVWITAARSGSSTTAKKPSIDDVLNGLPSDE